MRRACLLVLAVFTLWAPAAAADLYRWIDPETGSVKFSSSPPPWHGDPAKERRAPKVLVIPAGRAAAPVLPEAAPAAAGEPPAGAPGELEAQRKAMLQRVAALAGQAANPRGAQALARQLEGYKELSDQIDRLDPAGAAARRVELELLVKKAFARSAP
jgi:hypothetical protein